jgi:hypothetical protein
MLRKLVDVGSLSVPKGNQFSGGPRRPPFKRRDEVTRETVALALLYTLLVGLGMYVLINWMG